MKKYAIYWKHPEDEEYNIILTESVKECVDYMKSLLDRRLYDPTEGYISFGKFKISEFWW